jgi:GntR family transcriptional repressor for pyruvate dehydrogenase complex
MNMVAKVLFDIRIKTVKRATDLKESAEMHRRIYRAIRERDAEAASEMMHEHLTRAQRGWELEDEIGLHVAAPPVDAGGNGASHAS